MEVASVGGTTNGQNTGAKSKSGGLASLMGGGKGKGKGKENNMLSSLGSLFGGGGKGKAKSSQSQSNMLSSLASLLGGKGGKSKFPEEEIATAWLDNYLRLHKPEAEEDSKINYPSALDVMTARGVTVQQDGNVAAPPPDTESTAPRSAAMGARTSFRVSIQVH
jgi:hypothetical protein